MNFVLGIAGAQCAEEIVSQALGRASQSGTSAREARSFGKGRVCAATVSDGGAVLGVASSPGTQLLLFGSVHAPLPGGAVADDPDRVAQLLLERYASVGNRFLDNVCGHFAVCVLEPGRDRVLLVRGHGSAPRWFLSGGTGVLRFSTRLVDQLAIEPSTSLDRSMEDFLLGYEFLPNCRTPYCGVEELAAGSMLSWQGGEVERYELPKPKPWGARFDGLDAEDENAVVAALGQAFDQALLDQVPEAQRVGVLLGGVDSAFIAAKLSGLGKEVHTFSFCYDDDSYNQAFTEELAEQFGLTHHWVPVTPRVVQDGLTHFAARYNRVVAQPHYLIATTEVCRVARSVGVEHCLTGDGCDGLFMGYPTVHQRAQLIARLAKVAPLLRRPLSWLTGACSLEKRLGHPYRVARNVRRILSRPLPARAHVGACTLDSDSLRMLRGQPPPQERDTEAVLSDLASGLGDVGTVRLAYLGKGRVGLNASKLDGAMRCTGVRLNSPYLHPGLAALAQQIPDSFSRRKGDAASRATGKYAFLKMVERARVLPREMVYQKKCSPVTAPVDQWYWGSLRVFVRRRFEQLPFAVEPAYAESLLQPKWTELLFRELIGLGRYVTPAAAILASYASFAEHAQRT